MIFLFVIIDVFITLCCSYSVSLCHANHLDEPARRESGPSTLVQRPTSNFKARRWSRALEHGKKQCYKSLAK